VWTAAVASHLIQQTFTVLLTEEWEYSLAWVVPDDTDGVLGDIFGCMLQHDIQRLFITT